MGKNSVSPSTTPKMTALIKKMKSIARILKPYAVNSCRIGDSRPFLAFGLKLQIILRSLGLK